MAGPDVGDQVLTSTFLIGWRYRRSLIFLNSRGSTELPQTIGKLAIAPTALSQFSQSQLLRVIWKLEKVISEHPPRTQSKDSMSTFPNFIDASTRNSVSVHLH